MDMEANLPVPPATPSRNLVRPILNQDTSSSLSSSSSSSSPSDFLRHVQAAFKRHHPLGTMQSSSIGPRRTLVPQREASRSSGSNVVSPADASITPPTLSGTITKTFDVHNEQPKPDIGCKEINPMSLSLVESHHVDVQRKVQFSTGNNAGSQEMEWDASNQVEASTVVNHDQNFHNAESDISLNSDGGVSSFLAKRTTTVEDQLFRNFLNQPATQSSVVGSSCATTTSIHPASAPMLNSTTYCSLSHRDGGSHMAGESLGDFNVNPQPLNQGDMTQPSNPLLKDTGGILVDQMSTAAPASTSAIHAKVEAKEYDLSKEQLRCMEIGSDVHKIKSTKGEGYTGDVTDGQSLAPLSKNPSSDVKLDSKPETQEKAGSSNGVSVLRKCNYDPDLFFKVHVQLYQRLSKIGNGGSSEVHQVISSDCTIYALKRIKLKDRD